MSTEYENVGEINDAFEEFAQDVKDSGYSLEGAIRVTNDDEDSVEAINLDPGTLNTPDYEDQVSTPTDEKTAHEAGPGPTAGVPDEALPETGQTTDGSDGTEATDAAQEKADELGVDLNDVEGSGKDGRVTVSDVEDAAKE